MVCSEFRCKGAELTEKGDGFQVPPLKKVRVGIQQLASYPFGFVPLTRAPGLTA
jgi:hypothetical protein